MTTPLDPVDVELLLLARHELGDRPDLDRLRNLLDDLDADLRPAHVEPTDELRDWLDGAPSVVASAAARARLRLAGKLASASIGVKLALGGAAAAVALAAATAGGVLPTPAPQPVDHAVDPSQEPPRHSTPTTVLPQPVEPRHVLSPDRGTSGAQTPDTVDREPPVAAGTEAEHPLSGQPPTPPAIPSHPGGTTAPPPGSGEDGPGDLDDPGGQGNGTGQDTDADPDPDTDTDTPGTSTDDTDADPTGAGAGVGDAPAADTGGNSSPTP